MVRLVVALLLLIPTASSQQAELAEKARRAKRFMAESKFTEAAAIYGELNQAVPNNPGLLLNLGMAHHFAGESTRAIPEFEAALRIQPGIVPALLFLGSSYLDAGQPAKAIPPLRELVSAEPEMKEARQMYGDALAGTGRLEEALAHYRGWTGLDSANPHAWFSLVNAYETLSRKTFAALVEAYPESAETLALLGEVRLSQKQYRSAFFLYRKALEQRPDFKGLHAGVASVYRATERPDWAAKAEELENAVPPPDCKPHKWACDFAAGRYLAVTRAPADSAETLYWRSRAFNALAMEARERLAALPPSRESHRLLAELHTNQDRHMEAVKEWRAALQLAPGDADLETDLAISVYRSRDYKAALAILLPLLKRRPGSAEVLFYIGDCLLNLQQPEKAAPHLSQSVEKAPGFLPARSALGRALLQLRQGAEAVPHLKAALPLDEDGSLHFQLARAYQTSGDAAAAKEMLAKYQEIRRTNEAERRELDAVARITAP